MSLKIKGRKGFFCCVPKENLDFVFSDRAGRFLRRNTGDSGEKENYDDTRRKWREALRDRYEKWWPVSAAREEMIKDMLEQV